MTWIRHTVPPAAAHACTPPTVERFITRPAPPPPPAGWQGNEPPKPKRVKLDDVPAGQWRDLWRCDDCGELWRVGNDYAWRAATWWQRYRNRRRGAA